MHQKPESTNQPEPDANSNKPYTICSQPWWRGVGHGAISPDVLGKSTSKPSSLQHPNGGLGTKASKSQANSGQDEGADANKEMLITVVPRSDGNCGQEGQNLQHAVSIMPSTMGEYLTSPTQMELIGHSIGCASYPYSDPYYGGLMHAYGPQALVHSHFHGVNPTRMALPLEMAEEPVYVNAKQYHGILRRRQSRAKAELEKKLIKVRKPYLHESRHQHALRRARGGGGRFVNTKKLDSAAVNTTPDKGTGSGAAVSANPISSLGSEPVPSNSSGNADSITGHQEVRGPLVQETHKVHSFSNGNGNVNGCHPHHHGFQMSTHHALSGERVEEGDCSGQQRERIVVNGASHRALTIK